MGAAQKSRKNPEINKKSLNFIFLQITISQVDRRGSPLVFKATLIETRGAEPLVLLDFRLSRGDGLEFKRHFIRLKENLKHIQHGGAPINWLIEQ